MVRAGQGGHPGLHPRVVQKRANREQRGERYDRPSDPPEPPSTLARRDERALELAGLLEGVRAHCKGFCEHVGPQ
jgi:hypothetical protein